MKQNKNFKPKHRKILNQSNKTHVDLSRDLFACNMSSDNISQVAFQTSHGVPTLLLLT